MSTRTEPAGHIEPPRSCPSCQSLIGPDDHYCERCGTDVRSGARVWLVEVAFDDEYFARMAPDGYPRPEPIPAPVVHKLCVDETAVGRSSERETVGADAALKVADPGVSQRHALIKRAGRGYDIADLGSTNGTLLNDDTEPILPHHPVPLEDGDRVHLGMWTTITVRLQR